MCNSDKQKDLAVRPLKNVKGGFLVWKELGETPLETLVRVRAELKLEPEVKMTYAGRLDPAAEGELLVLTGDKCKEKDNYLGLDKTYRFKILIGPETDTLDLLGIPLQDKLGERNILYQKAIFDNKNNLKNKYLLANLVGMHQLPYPAYSSRTVNGKPLWQYSREGEYFNLLDQEQVPLNNFKIYQLNYIDSKVITGVILKEYIAELAGKVSGNFRQNAIIDTWSKIVTITSNYLILKFEVKVSSGTYVRQIAQMILQRIKLTGVVFSITRTKIHIEE